MVVDAAGYDDANSAGLGPHVFLHPFPVYQLAAAFIRYFGIFFSFERINRSSTHLRSLYRKGAGYLLQYTSVMTFRYPRKGTYESNDFTRCPVERGRVAHRVFRYFPCSRLM